MQTFCIPTEGDHDADATTHADIAPLVPAGFDDWFTDIGLVASEQGEDALRAAWKKSSRDYRDYTVEHRKLDWEHMKAIASITSTVAK